MSTARCFALLRCKKRELLAELQLRVDDLRASSRRVRAVSAPFANGRRASE